MPKTSLNRLHKGIGVHSVRVFHPQKTGPQHSTGECIRTNEEAIHDSISFDNLSPVTVINSLSKRVKK